MKAFIRLFVCILLCQMAGVIGSIFTTPAILGWYEGLSKPFFRPPNWVFGPVWVTLYLLMGISAFLVWQKKRLDKPSLESGCSVRFATVFKRSVVGRILRAEVANSRNGRDCGSFCRYLVDDNKLL